MQTKNNHTGEHMSYPADKMLPKSIKGSQRTNKQEHKTHYKRSRRWNKKIIQEEYCI